MLPISSSVSAVVFLENQKKVPLFVLKSIVSRSFNTSVFLPLSSAVKTRQPVFYTSARPCLWRQSAPLMQA